MANDVIARGLALRGISDAAAAVRATEKMVEITSITGSGSNRTLTGNAPPNTVVTIHDSGASIGTAQATATGSWVFRATGLSDGDHTLTARAPLGSASVSAAINDGTPPATGFAELPRWGFRVSATRYPFFSGGSITAPTEMATASPPCPQIPTASRRVTVC